MFVSPCTLRSAQCAALIALATVAGIARTETPAPTTPSDDTSTAVAQSHRAASSLHHDFVFARAWSRPWLQPVATIALWLFSGGDDHTVELIASTPTAPAPDQADCSEASDASPLLCFLPLAAAGSFQREPSPALCTLPYVIPFASGPPAPHANHTHRADVTWGLSDVTAFRKFISPVVPSSFSIVARLACREFAGHSLAAPFFHPSSALRGEPVLLPSLACFRPCLGASGRRAAITFSS